MREQTATKTTSKSTSDIFKHKTGAYRSGLEEIIKEQLNEHKISALYEPFRISYKPKMKTYTPDFLLPNGIVIETKGYFTPADRAKHLLIQEQYPDIDLRFIFTNARQRINKKSETTYGSWCIRHDFKFAEKTIPEKWLNEKFNLKSYNALKKASKGV